jgi:hypothetical protein
MKNFMKRSSLQAGSIQFVLCKQDNARRIASRQNIHAVYFKEDIPSLLKSHFTQPGHPYTSSHGNEYVLNDGGDIWLHGIIQQIHHDRSLNRATVDNSAGKRKRT